MAYTHLRLYRRPDSYMGPTWEGYFPFLGQSRDSSTLERSNFRAGLEKIGGESDTVLIIRDSHWAVGWVETIYIHESDAEALTLADTILGKLEDYPVVSEDDWTELEWDTAAEYWENASVRERMEWCKRYDVSVFAARRSEIPRDPRGELISALAE